ncbi:MAG: hypothetical protein EBQ80_02990 [Proteobacteria bacterium]|nr:hypothetical protein [Bacteroidota bacterium]NBX86193.1 hypothetical protein [Pseudomonadota bacterium]
MKKIEKSLETSQKLEIVWPWWFKLTCLLVSLFMGCFLAFVVVDLLGFNDYSVVVNEEIQHAD